MEPTVDEVLVLELHAEDGLTNRAIASSEIATLRHEARNHPVEGAALVVERFLGLSNALLASAKAPEVFGGAGRFGRQVHDDSADWRAANRNIEKHSGVGHL